MLIMSCAGSPKKQETPSGEPASLREAPEPVSEPEPVSAPQAVPEPVITVIPVDEEEPVEELALSDEPDEATIEELVIDMFEKIAGEEVPAEEPDQPELAREDEIEQPPVEAPPELAIESPGPVPSAAAAPPPVPQPLMSSPLPAKPAVPPSPRETPVPVREAEPPPIITPVIPGEPPPALEWPGPSPDFRPLPDGKADVPMAFSRIVRATAGQLVEVPFRGLGWVFLGEANGRRGIAYDSRRLDPEGQSFIFRADSAGTYALKFYRQDFIRDYILNDYVQVIIGNAPETAGSGWFSPPIDRGRVIAEPRWPAALDDASASASPLPGASAQAAPSKPLPTAPPAGPQTETQQTEQPAQPPARPRQPPAGQTRLPPSPESDEGVIPVRPPVIADETQPAQSPAELPPDSAPDVYLKKVKEEYDAGRIASAISLLDQFREHYPSGSDEAWWQYGQCLEANSPSRNILGALDYYRRLVNEYPQSGRATDARRRISYLERYYINIQ